ncbi:MAG: S8 family serine peptidase, partial [Rhodospirillaceae bacterium]|nr:S8 family serine peptidase [Rhodospirillaceae bacterium]
MILWAKKCISRTVRAARYGVVALLVGAAATPAHAQIESILQQLEANGHARVIVRMKAAAEGQAWTQAASVYEQRATVEQMRRSLESSLAASDLVIDQSFSSLPFVGLQIDRERLGALLSLSDVAGVYPVTVERKAKPQTSSAFEGPAVASSVPSIDVEDAWARGYDGDGLTVAVIDGGIAINHAMLSGKAVGAACFSATFGGDTFTQCPSGQTPEIGPAAASNCPFGSDRCDHGTHVASVAVGNDGTNFGVARGAQLMPIDVFSEVTDESVCDPDPAPCELTDSL